ncbi:putative transcriptional regulatory protein, MarR family [Bradyrhizobium sp. ORS 375]|uniref:MarR family winged helix-turn-helix transcriptional regulator n=1 Tax=Bradyrhizobium sp. (strain ORS 375) TaxID=566679 RepID=UPI0002406EE9|nr:MarR family winged helix-turn-helix transcriptional regulator [Bradyrhizobium sp. ORS 375]CCD93665.1 putative transcriptional regulatory protein, MarR family [Bradyrhizobium sp. ORS 375]
MSKSASARAQRDGAGRDAGIGLGELESHLGYFVRRLQHWIFRDVNAALASLELDVILYSILETIAANPGATQIAIAGALGIERARMVGLLDDLQQAGLIVRERSEQDRRAHALGLTPRGRMILKKANLAVAAHEKRVARRLGADNYRRALSALSQFETD